MIICLGANTGIAHLRNEPDIVKVHEEFLKGSVVVTSSASRREVEAFNRADPATSRA